MLPFFVGMGATLIVLFRARCGGFEEKGGRGKGGGGRFFEVEKGGGGI